MRDLGIFTRRDQAKLPEKSSDVLFLSLLFFLGPNSFYSGAPMVYFTEKTSTFFLGSNVSNTFQGAQIENSY